MSMDGDIGGRDGDSILVAEYALGLLPAAEHEAVARRLAAEPALRAELRSWRLRFQGLDADFAEQQVPAGVLGRIEGRLFGETRSSGGLAGWWNSLALWRGLAAAGVAVAAIAVGLNLAQPRVDPRAVATQLVAALREEGSNVSFVALFDPASGVLRLTALSGEPVADRDYELWAIQGSDAPVSMGVVPVEARMEMPVAADILAEFGEGTVLAVTLEPKGGSPTGDPTGPVVAKGAATAI
jgi:anti-sigma-K factor RskA